MGKLVLPDNVGWLKIAGTVLVPDAKHEVVVTAGVASEITPKQFQPYLVTTDLATGAVTVKLPALVTEIAFNGTNYVGDGANMIVLPPLIATGFLGANGGYPFKFYDPTVIQLPAATKSFDFLSGVLPPEVTFTRASVGTYFDAAGVMQSAAANQPRFDYNPLTHEALGLLVEEARTNSNPNSTAVGAVVGSPGTLPNTWQGSNPIAGLSRSIVGFGVEDGIEYVDIRWSGVANAAGGSLLVLSGSTAVVASLGQNWTASIFVKLVGGSYSNVTQLILRMAERTAAGGFLQYTGLGDLLVPSQSGKLSTGRQAHSAQLISATVGCVTEDIIFGGMVVGQPADFTLRIGLPQLELGAFATSAIKTTAAATTRSADNAVVTGAAFSAFWNQAQGTVQAEFTSPAVPTAPTKAIWAAGDPALAFGAANNIYQSIPNGSVVVSANVNAGGVVQAGNVSNNLLTTGGAFNTAFAYVANNFQGVMNGVLFAPDTSGTVPPVVGLSIGSLTQGWTGTANQLNGTIKSFRYWNTALTPEQLQAATV
jgi:hypothetical protein